MPVDKKRLADVGKLFKLGPLQGTKPRQRRPDSEYVACLCCLFGEVSNQGRMKTEIVAARRPCYLAFSHVWLAGSIQGLLWWIAKIRIGAAHARACSLTHPHHAHARLPRPRHQDLRARVSACAPPDPAARPLPGLAPY